MNDIPAIPKLEDIVPRLPAPLDEVAKGGAVFLTGKMRSGKSYVAKRLSRRETVKLSTPMWAVAENFFGEDLSKDKPGIRELMQEIGRLGRGDFGPDFKPTPSRASFIQSVRDHGEEITDSLRDDGQMFDLITDENKSFQQYARNEYDRIDWSKFAKTEDFWVDILCGRLDARREARDCDELPAVPDVRYPNEVERLLGRGFRHVHVTATEHTRVDRGAPAFRDDRTEQLGDELDHTWNRPSGVPHGEMTDRLTDTCPEAMRRVASSGAVVWSDPEEDCPGALTRASSLIRLSKIYPMFVPIN